MRAPNRILLLVLAALLLAFVPASASAQATYSNSGGGASAAQTDDDADYGGYSDGGSGGRGNDGGSSEYDQYYDDSYDEEAENGGQEPSGSLPDTQTTTVPKTPSKTPTTPTAPEPPAQTVAGPYTTGLTARMMSNGKAAIPRTAPKSVRQMIAAANRLIGKPYKWGGGHAKLQDSGYDCSGSVSYALIYGGQLTSPLVSGGLAKWGLAGAGKWVTVYANKNHVYMEIAGLRLDTSPIGDPGGKNGPRWRPLIGGRKNFKVRHPLGL